MLTYVSQHITKSVTEAGEMFGFAKEMCHRNQFETFWPACGVNVKNAKKV